MTDIDKKERKMDVDFKQLLTMIMACLLQCTVIQFLAADRYNTSTSMQIHLFQKTLLRNCPEVYTVSADCFTFTLT